MSWKGDAATKAVLARRFQELQNRRLFYVWEVRRELPQAMLEVKGVENAAVEFNAFMKGKLKDAPPFNVYRNEHANRLNRALRASSDLSQLEIRVDDLLDQEESGRVVPLFSKQQFENLAFRSGSLVFDINQYAACELAKLAPVKAMLHFGR